MKAKSFSLLLFYSLYLFTDSPNPWVKLTVRFVLLTAFGFRLFAFCLKQNSRFASWFIFSLYLLRTFSACCLSGPFIVSGRCGWWTLLFLSFSFLNFFNLASVVATWLSSFSICLCGWLFLSVSITPRFGSAKVEIFFTLSKKTFEVFLSPLNPPSFSSLNPSRWGRKGTIFKIIRQVLFSLFLDYFSFA